MASESNGSTCTLTFPRRLFTEEFLAYLAARDEPETASEAEMAGTCHVVPDPQGGWAVLGEGESLEAGDVPLATFLREELALIATAVLPGTARRLRFQHARMPASGASPSSSTARWSATCGTLMSRWPRAMTVVDALLASPCDFGWMLLAAGGLALERVQRVAAGRMTPHP